MQGGFFSSSYRPQAKTAMLDRHMTINGYRQHRPNRKRLYTHPTYMRVMYGSFLMITLSLSFSIAMLQSGHRLTSRWVPNPLTSHLHRHF